MAAEKEEKVDLGRVRATVAGSDQWRGVEGSVPFEIDFEQEEGIRERLTLVLTYTRAGGYPVTPDLGHLDYAWQALLAAREKAARRAGLLSRIIEAARGGLHVPPPKQEAHCPLCEALEDAEQESLRKDPVKQPGPGFSDGSKRD